MTSQETAFPPRAQKIAPRYFVYAAWSIPLGILAQFFLAGLSMFQDAGLWGLHATMGFLLLIPVTIVAAAPLMVAAIRPLRWWSGFVALLYVMQIVWIVAGQNAGSGFLQAMHPLNAGLLLMAALVVVAKIGKSHSA